MRPASSPDSTAGRSACAGCGAAVPAGAPWCTQCFRPAGPAAVPAPEQVRVGPPSAAGTWPCTACGSATPLAADVCAGCGLGFLAAVRQGARSVAVLPLVGDLTRLSAAQRVGLALAVVLLVGVLTALVGGALA